MTKNKLQGLQAICVKWTEHSYKMYKDDGVYIEFTLDKSSIMNFKLLFTVKI